MKIFKAVLFVVLSIIISASLAAKGGLVTVKNLRASTTGDKTRLVFDLDATPHYQTEILTQPNRLVLSIQGGDVAQPFNKKIVKLLANTPVKSLETSVKNKNPLQITFNLKSPIKIKTFVLPPAEKYGNRLVIDMVPISGTEEKMAETAPVNSTVVVQAKEPVSDLPSPPVVQNPTLVSAQTQTTSKKQELPANVPAMRAAKPSKMAYVDQDFDLSRGKPLVKESTDKGKKPSWGKMRNTFLPHHASRDIVVVIDPGHGGKDPGAMGRLGTREKMVVLQISKILQQMLNQEPGFRAVLTRNDDNFIPLRERLTIARRDRADIFVAIHADAYKNTDASGASVFALSERGATSEAARWLAEKENYSELIGGGDLPDKDNLLRSVLIDLSQNHTISVSLKMGTAVLRELSKVSNLHYKRVEQAAFVVLKSPDIPSLLVETGYLSNPAGEAQLRNPAYQQRIAFAVMRGIKSYFIQNPPQGSLLSSNSYDTPTRYVVTEGDTLPLIAYRYHVNVEQIRKMNQLATDQLQVGQTLWLPPKQRYV